MSESLRSQLRRAGVVIRIGYPMALARLLDRHVLAITVGRHIWIHPRAAEIGPELLERIIRHELVHVAQYERDGVIPFLFRYLSEYLSGRWAGLSHREAYRAISYEREAYGQEI